MPRISPLETREQSTETQIAFIQHKTVYNSPITNAKATLGHSALAFKVYMQWYPLFEETKTILGARLATLFALSISEASDSAYSGAYFRKTIIDSGEDPEQLTVSDEEQILLNFGTAIGENKGFVPDEIFRPIRKKYSNEKILLFTAFAGIMIANNVFNNAIQIGIDEYLQPYTPQHQTVYKQDSLFNPDTQMKRFPNLATLIFSLLIEQYVPTLWLSIFRKNSEA